MKNKIFLCVFIASMFFFNSCAKDEENMLQSDFIGTWVNMKNFSEEGVLNVPNSPYNPRYYECSYIVVSKRIYELHYHVAKYTDSITFKNGVLDISQSDKWDIFKFKYSIHDNELYLDGSPAGTFDISSGRMVIKTDLENEVWLKVKEVKTPEK